MGVLNHVLTDHNLIAINTELDWLKKIDLVYRLTVE